MNYSNEKQQEPNNNRPMKIVIGLIIFCVLLILALVGVIYYLQSLQFNIYVDGAVKNSLYNYFEFEPDGTVYVSITDVAEALGYEASVGEYKVFTEGKDKCHVKNEYESTSFFLNSNKAMKCRIDTDTQEDYEVYELENVVKQVGDKLYVSEDALELACNVKFSYNKAGKNIRIVTLKKLANDYKNSITNLGYEKLSDDFFNQKAMLYGLFVVENEKNQIGVIKISGGGSNLSKTVVIGVRYNQVEFLENSQEFKVTSIDKNNVVKMGIKSIDGSEVIPMAYDELKVIEKDLGLYLVQEGEKYGVIDKNGKRVIYSEYDKIGIDSSDFPNNVDNQYILLGKVIPVMQNNKWGLFNVEGKEISKPVYDSLGCIANVQDKIVNNVIAIEGLNAIVTEKDDLYGLITVDGEKIDPILTNIYSITSRRSRNIL